MTNRSKAIGSEWERRLLDYFRANFGNGERLALAGINDEGDLWFQWNGQAYVIEAKAEKSLNLSSYVQEAEREAGNWHRSRPIWGRPYWAAISKRRNHGVGKAYVTMTLDEYVRLVKR